MTAGDDVAVPAAGLGLDVSGEVELPAPQEPYKVQEPLTLEERIEAEGAKLREAEVLAGERKATRNDGMRWRGEASRGRADVGRPQGPSRFKSEHYSGQKGMPGAMLE